jgi:hypothetical protein
MISRSSTLADEARIFAETIVDSWFPDGTATPTSPVPAVPFPSIESPIAVGSPHPDWRRLGKGIPGQVYH